MIKPDTTAHSMTLRRRLIISGDGRSTVETIAPCPRRGAQVPVDVCLECEHFAGIDESSDPRRSFLLCRVTPLVATGETDDDVEAPSVADRTPLSAAMTTNVICVRQDVTLDSLTVLFLERGISGAPVVDAEGFPIGVITKTDLLREHHERGGVVEVTHLRVERIDGIEYVLDEGFHDDHRVTRVTAGDVMMPLAFTLLENAPLSQAAALMAFEGVHRVPVVSPVGKVVGILSSLDVLRWLARHDGYLTREAGPTDLA